MVRLENYLSSSPLYKSLLTGDEIRYSDFIAFYINTAKANPFSSKNSDLKQPFKVLREKTRNDIKVNLIKQNREGKLYEMPHILVENKLKSLPDVDQLIQYTKSFVNEFIDSYKNILRTHSGESIRKNRLIDATPEILMGIENLEFYLLTPQGGENKVVTINIVELNANKDITWVHKSFYELGENIKSYIKNKKFASTIKAILHGYFFKYQYNEAIIKDFASILMSLTLKVKNFNAFSEDDTILDIFNTKYIDNELTILFSKIRASACEQLLRKRFPNNVNRGHNLPSNLINDRIGTIVTIDGYSPKGGGAHFDIAKKINNKVTYILQYQGGSLRKGLTIPSNINTTGIYTQWFINNQFNNPPNILFNVANVNGATDRDRYNFFDNLDGKFIMYYSKLDVQNFTVSEVLDLMEQLISDQNQMNTLINLNQAIGLI